jgi:hypothetical protein
MIHRFALSLACSLLLLGSATGTTLAGTHHAGHRSSGHATAQQQGLLLVRTYLTVLNTGLHTGDFSALPAVYAPDATFAYSISVKPGGVLEQQRPVRGFPLISNLYRVLSGSYHGYHWSQDQMSWTSTTEMMSHEHVQSPRLSHQLTSWTRYVIRNGKISSLDWNISYVLYPAGGLSVGEEG